MARPGGDPLRDYYYGGSYASSGVGDVARGSGWGALVVAGVRIPSGPLLRPKDPKLLGGLYMLSLCNLLLVPVIFGRLQ